MSKIRMCSLNYKPFQKSYMSMNIIEINQKLLKEILIGATNTDRSGKMTCRELTQGMFNTIGGNITLRFGRTEVDSSTGSVDFYFSKVKLLTPKRFVLEGSAYISRNPVTINPTKLLVDYIFDKQTFYQAVYCSNGIVRDMKPLSLDYAGLLGRENVETVRKLIQYLSTYQFSIKDNET